MYRDTFVLEGSPITKKNSARILSNGKIFPSKQYIAYEKSCLLQLLGIKPHRFGNSKVCVKALFFCKDKARRDLVNLMQALADILQKAEVIEDVVS